MARQRKRGTFVDLGTFEAPGLAARRARAYVPAGPAAERAVLVMLDGQNVFGDEGSFAGGWHADETVDRLARARAPVAGSAAGGTAQAPVIVAIDHGGAERIAELGAPASPKLAVFVDLVVGQVLPAARAKLPLADPPARRIVCGSSMGGLAALYMHFRKPDVFGGAIAMSPSLWYGRRVDGPAGGGTSQATTIFDFIAREPNPWRSRVWLDAGAREAGGRLVGAVESMAKSLRERGWGDGGDLRVATLVDPRGKHDEASWRRRLPKALRFAFAP